MEIRVATERNEAESQTLWPIILQACTATVVVGIQVREHWAAWNQFDKVIGISILVMLVAVPAAETVRKRIGKPVRHGVLAFVAYNLLWLTVLVLKHPTFRLQKIKRPELCLVCISSAIVFVKSR